MQVTKSMEWESTLDDVTPCAEGVTMVIIIGRRSDGRYFHEKKKLVSPTESDIQEGKRETRQALDKWLNWEKPDAAS